MGSEYSFTYKISCELIVVSQNFPPDVISEKINIRPSRAFSKGETFQSPKSGTVGKRIQNLWAVKSKTIITEDVNISSHINYFRDILENKIEIIHDLKSDSKNEITFWIWIETNGVGTSFDIPEIDLMFINRISNRLQVSIVGN